MLNSNNLAIEKCKHRLLQTPLINWLQLIEETASTVNLKDKSSVQEAIDEFIRAYGPIEKPFSSDLFSPNSLLGMVLHQTENKPNSMQLGLVQYCIGSLRKSQKQLWCVPSGQGKSRIMAFACLLALQTEIFTKVYMVFDNDYLMNRDKAVF